MGIEIRECSVEVFAENMLLNGRVRSGRRLTDLVNEPDPYISLDDVRLYPYAADVILGLDEHRHGMINKASVVLITELTQVAGDGGMVGQIGARVAKQPLRILIYADQFAINANIHLAAGVELAQMLTLGAPSFLPLTNATVTPTEPKTQLTSFRRDFLLVNTQQIRYLGGAEDGRPGDAREGGPDEDLIG